jgi:predicted nucleic acid-binding protein
VESSALLRVILERDIDLEATVRRFDRRFTSALTLIEVQRAIVRSGRERRLSPSGSARAQQDYRAFAEACSIAELTAAIRKRAMLDFPVEPVRALDAIHLATMLAWTDIRGGLVMVSCDRRVRENASALGFEVVP